MHQKGVKVILGCNAGKKLEGGCLNFDKAEFSLIVERVADDSCRRYRKVMVNHWVKKVLQGGGAWGDRAKSSNGFGLDELLDTLSKVFSKGKCLARGSGKLGTLGKRFGKKEEVFICKINVKQACETWGFVSNFHVPKVQC